MSYASNRETLNELTLSGHSRITFNGATVGAVTARESSTNKPIPLLRISVHDFAEVSHNSAEV